LGIVDWIRIKFTTHKKLSFIVYLSFIHHSPLKSINCGKLIWLIGNFAIGESKIGYKN